MGIEPNGLTIEAGDSTIRGLVIVDFNDDAIELDVAGGNTIAGNYFGVLADGTTQTGNGWGVAVKTSGNTIGGTAAADRNVISGNDNYGLSIYDAAANNVVQGNYIGTTAGGDVSLGNGNQGVFIEAGANHNTIGGTSVAHRNVISGNGTFGIEISGAGTDSNTVIGNYIGTALDGVTSLPNVTGLGIVNGATSSTIGGLTSTHRNVISGNINDGILIQGNDTTGHVIIGNYIGTDSSGTADLGNGNNGIYIDGSPGNTVGGLTAGHRNVISGNDNNGILLDGTDATNTTIQGNYVGLNATGAAAIANSDDGIDLSDAPGNTIGGALPGAGNVISGQGDTGLLLIGALTTGNVAFGNLIGTDAAGNMPVPNGTGVSIHDGAADNRIGGVNADEANLIAHNTGDGVWVTDTSGMNNALLSNSISANGELGIDLGPDGVTANGPGDPLNFPVIDSAYHATGIVTLSGTFDVQAGSYRFEFFANSAADASGYGEGETLVGSTPMTHTGSGPEPWGAAFPGALGDIITATLTECTDSGCDDFNSTSEFSEAVTVTTNLAPVATDDPPAGSYVVSPGGWGQWDVMGNDSDPNGDSLYLQSFTQPTLGTVVRVDGGTPLDTTDDFLRYTAPLSPTGATTFTYTISDGLLTDTATVYVNVGVPNNPPSPDAGGPYTIAEGETLNLDASGSSDADGDSLTYAWDLDGDGFYDDAFGFAPSVDWTVLAPLGINDDGSYTVAVQVDDGMLTAADSASLTVDDTLPTISVSGTGSTVAGVPHSVDLSVSDPGNDPTVSWMINWGDGTVETIPGNPLNATHTYTRAGFTYNILASVLDDASLRTWNTDIVVPYWETTNMVVRYDSYTGATIADLGATSSIDEPHTVAYGPNGYLYVSDDVSNTIERFDPATNSHAGTFISSGLDEPRGITFGPDGDLFVANFQTGEVLRFDGISGAPEGVFATGPAQFAPTGLEFGPDGDLYVTDNGNDTVEQFDGTSGTHVVTFSSHQNNGLLEDLTFAPDGTLYVSVLWSNRIDHVDTDGTIIGSVPLTAPSGLSIGPDGMLWASSMTTDSVVRIDRSTNTVVATAISEPPIAGPTYSDFIADHRVEVNHPADTTPPVITLLGSSPIDVEAGTAYIDAGATAWDAFEGDLTASIVTTNPVDTSTLGTYTVRYNVSDSSGNAATEVTRIVNVVDTTAPVITLLGSTPIDVEAGTVYVDAGASAVDSFEGDLTGSIFVVNPVNTALLGTYTVTYTVSDSSGNAATPVTRIVNVVDTTAPVITLLGSTPVTVEAGSAYLDAGATATDTSR